MNKISLAALLLISVSTLAGCQKADSAPHQANADGEKPKKEEVAIPVEVSDVTRGSIEAAYRGTATLEAADEATVVAKTAGVVEQIAVEEGERVKAGQVLARLETDRLQLEMERARATLNQLEQDFKRNESIYKQNLISREVYDRTRFELEAARAAYELAALTLRESAIRAPIDGVVSARHIKTGNMLQVNAPTFRITQLDALEAQIYVPERDIHKLAISHPTTLTVDAWPGEKFSGQVERINPVVDPATGTVKVTVVVADAQQRLKPGMFGRVQIRYDRRDDAVLVAKDAVLVEDAAESVFVVDEEGRAHRRAIQTGYADAEHYEVVEGLKDGERVITTGQANLKDKARVEVVQTLAAS